MSSSSTSGVDPGTGAPLLHTPSGVVSGSWRRHGSGPAVAVFRAVPVSAPHTDGSAAFAAPRPAPSWPGTLDCPDTEERRGLGATHTATVTCPAESTGGPYPVMVWVHGGRFETGHADDPRYDATALAAEGCVVVAVNYRKRFEGFLPVGDSADGDFRGVGDLVASLRWVRDCIGDVGGDVDRVTLAGQSAGGALVAWLLADERASGLFHRAVMMSPGAPRRGWSQRRLTTALALRRWGRRPTAESMASLSAGELTDAYRRFARFHVTDCAVGVHPFTPSGMRPVPVITGTMHDEFVRFPGVRQVDAVLRRTLGRAAERLGLPRVAEAWAVAPAMLVLGVPVRSVPAWCRSVSTTTPVRPLGRTVGDRMIRRWASAFAESLADSGAPVWAYEFRDDARPAQHCGELPLLFGTPGGPGGPGTQFRDAVVGFVHGREPDWDRYTVPQRRARVFDLSGASTAPARPDQADDPWRDVRTLAGPLYPGTRGTPAGPRVVDGG
ncbi:carboxylesterase family protein [Corynebacterium sp.]|uniref:carboxylesterase family protein n=1 Tax=Corynebacterium sp. TaxID=1720 RepID=UPI003B3AE6A0